MVLEHLQYPSGHLLSDFRYRATHHLCPQIKPNNAGHRRLSGNVFINGAILISQFWLPSTRGCGYSIEGLKGHT
ncbi:hypothetical protein MTR_6g486155 [Medicago truncatula]|uniref:Uncharacterized protein n=1 Tax=Medicago truncatula TaxID=3880 RepID=A0A072UDB8_MEDTR|nr:hypothetical protein MTR_6g486155 [Medicago truncatula]